MAEVSNTAYLLAVNTSNTADRLRKLLRSIIEDATTTLEWLDKGIVFSTDPMADAIEDKVCRAQLDAMRQLFEQGDTELQPDDFKALVSGKSWRQVLKAREVAEPKP